MADSGGQVYIYEFESESMPISTFNIGPGGYWFERMGFMYINMLKTVWKSFHPNQSTSLKSGEILFN